MNENSDSRDWGKKLFKYGIPVAAVLSLGWFVYAVLIAYPQVTACTASWMTVNAIGPFPEQEIAQFNSCLKLNEFGDYLAGSFAPLAFLWLIIAVLIQSRELKAQQDALMDQLVESRKQTNFLHAEQATARAETNSKRFEKFLKLVRLALQDVNRGSPYTRDADDVTFMRYMAKKNADSIVKAIAVLKGDAKPLHGFHPESIVEYAKKIYPYIDELRSLERILSAQDLETYRACHMPEVLEALDELDRFIAQQAAQNEREPAT
ncbi:hypothetical protein [Roseibium sp. SCP14]|uniref:hypothetical protein n=1 Tax=Roseibium sp. SCP14 TaxID=3141375 RepID=UPI0033391C8F